MEKINTDYKRRTKLWLNFSRYENRDVALLMRKLIKFNWRKSKAIKREPVLSHFEIKFDILIQFKIVF